MTPGNTGVVQTLVGEVRTHVAGCTVRLATEELEKQFIKKSTAAGLDGLKGHRSVGGMRASIYNAFPEEGVNALVAFMREFERRQG